MTRPFFDTAAPNVQKLELLRQHFPQAIEVDAEGRVSVNAAALQQALDPANTGGARVREEDGYELRWVGKREAFHTAFLPPQKVLLPCPEDSKNWDDTGNLLIQGDNLDALRLLRQSYFGKVKLIYIDPPYNTQSDAFIYRDDFSAKQAQVLEQLGYSNDNIDYIKNIYGARTHSGWLSFMYPRLLLAKDLLAQDGVIFISIDDNEQAQLKVLCDEVFGQDQFVSDLIWKKKSGGANDSEHFAIDHEYVLVYANQKSEFVLKLDPNATVTTQYNRNDERGRYALDRLDKQSIRYSDSGNFEITGSDGQSYWPAHVDPERPNATWRWSKTKVAADFSELVFERGFVYTKNYEKDGAIARSLLTEERFGRTRTGKTDLFDLLKANVFTSPKPHRLISHFAAISTQSNDLILDFFAGSGTTGESVMRLNAEDGGQRKFILVQIPQPIDAKKQKDAHDFVTQTLGKPQATIFEITAERLRRAGAKVAAEHPGVDTGFRVFALVDDEDAQFLNTPLQAAAQADFERLQAQFATPQPAAVPRVLYNLLLAEHLPLSTRMAEVRADVLYRADDTLLVLQALPLAQLSDTLAALAQAGTPIRHVAVFSPWMTDDNFTLGIKTLLESNGFASDALRLRG